MPNGSRGRIRAQVLAWEGVRAEPQRFNGEVYRIGRCEIGHMHGDSLVDIPFTPEIRDQLVADGLAQPHHIVPDGGCVSVRVRSQADVSRALDPLRRAYELCKHRGRKRPLD